MIKKAADENSKAKIAKRVVTPKRRYFIPAAGVSVEADDMEKALKAAEKPKQESGDGE